MTPKKTNHEQDRLFEMRLSQQLNPHHPLLFLAELIEWGVLEEHIASVFDAKQGAPAKPVRLIVGILMLQHMSGLSDEQTLKVWVENPYWQMFCGYDFLQWKCPLDPSSLTNWRKRLGEDKMKVILGATVKCAINTQLVSKRDLQSAIADTTLMEKNIAHPTDARLYYKSLKSLIKVAQTHKIALRQTYKFMSKKQLRLSSSYAHARKMKQAKKAVRQLKTYLGRVLREVEKAAECNKDLEKLISPLLRTIRSIYSQRRDDKNKVYSVHEKDVECISKGKAHKKYEFGCKTSIIIAHKKGLVLTAEAVHGSPYDGHTLKGSIASAETVTGVPIKRIFVDKGYRGHGIHDKEVYISGSRKLTKHFKKLINRRQSIEPIIGHMKQDGKLGRNYLGQKIGDCINAVLCGIGNNIRLLLNHIAMQTA